MAISKEFLAQTRNVLFQQFLQAYDLHDRLYRLRMSMDYSHPAYEKSVRVFNKVTRRFYRRYEAFKAFREIEEREKALENSQPELKVIPGWQYSNLFTLPSALISVTQTGQSIKYPVGGLYSEISYRRKRIRGLGKRLYVRSVVFSKRVFPFPITYQYNIIHG